MKTRETKQRDLDALTQSLQTSNSAMIVSFSGVTVGKDQEFRDRLREAGAKYQVVKNTLARIAVKGTPFENATEHFKGVTALAWTDSDAVVLSKTISKFVKDNADHFTFKAGVIEGKVVDLAQLTTIASLPSKEELISKLLFVINAQAQRLVTVINAVPRNLAVVIKQIGELEDRPTGTPKVEAAPAAEADPAGEPTPADEAATAGIPENEGPDDAAAQAATEPEATAPEAATEIQEEEAANAPDDAAVEAVTAPDAEAPAEEPAAE
jgi:large subunit ribosomal protein L10